MSNPLALGVVVAAAVTAAVTDLRIRRVPNVLTMSVALVGLGLAGAGLGRVGIGASIAGCLIGLAVMLPGHLIGATGGGDVKLLASVGTLLGPTADASGHSLPWPLREASSPFSWLCAGAASA